MQNREYRPGFDPREASERAAKKRAENAEAEREKLNTNDLAQKQNRQASDPNADLKEAVEAGKIAQEYLEELKGKKKRNTKESQDTDGKHSG